MWQSRITKGNEIMKYSLVGNTDLKVSRICLGTMTWGEQNSEAEAHEQLDYEPRLRYFVRPKSSFLSRYDSL